MKRPEVLGQTDFRRFFVGQSVSLLGDQVAVLALPLTAVLVLHAGPRQVGLLTAAGIVPSLLFSLSAGGWIDRRGRRRQAMLVADVVRGLAVLSLPIGYAVGHLGLFQLYVVAFVVGSLDVVFFVAYQALLLTIVRRQDYVAANSLLNGSQSLAQVIGLALGGTVIGLLTAPGALVLDALSFGVSGSQLARIKPVEPERGSGESGGLLAGAGWIRGNAVVRTMLAAGAVLNLFAFVGIAVLVLFASRTLHLSPEIIGLVFGAGAVGGVLGAITCGRVGRRLGLGPTIGVASLVLPAAMLLYPAAQGPKVIGALFLIAGELISAVAVVWLEICIGTVRAHEVPDRMRSRVAGAYRTVNHGVRPIGAVIGGFLAAEIGLRNALWVSAAGAAFGAMLQFRPVILRLRAPVEYVG